MNSNELRDWMERSAHLLALEIPPVSEAGVLENLERNFAIAKVLSEVELTDLDEPSPIFLP